MADLVPSHRSTGSMTGRVTQRTVTHEWIHAGRALRPARHAVSAGWDLRLSQDVLDEMDVVAGT